ncbi:DUF1178 family protein [Phreatobacter aquaticus]|uniref:DUF1178 family protein n=1 Tax=Phreatobacter aquaticus TaxID=2570229 RepID=A0A4D7QHH8_9HYPH|nr:DUF1178 family protein [Phreatobacter aquaticus]QCK84827.1 DUF1178 family protein [Phreatobacter aquaticus]
MIKYALACDKAHEFESWFPSSDSFDAQQTRGLVACPVCGSTKVAKVIMAPQVARRDRRPEPISNAPVPAPQAPQPVAIVSEAEQELRAKIREFRDQLLAKSESVGDRFAEEARKIHYGETEHRTIHGQATPEEARELIEEGVEFHPIPVLPDERN